MYEGALQHSQHSLWAVIVGVVVQKHLEGCRLATPRLENSDLTDAAATGAQEHLSVVMFHTSCTLQAADILYILYFSRSVGRGSTGH